jgi:hypothetical protein
MKTLSTMAVAIAVTASSVPATAQTGQTTNVQESPRIQDRIGQILGQIFGGRNGSASSLDAEWAVGRFPLAAQRTQFEARVDAEVRSGAISYSNGNRLKTDYYSLVDLEARYGADRRFTTQERSELSARYEALTRALNDGGYSNGGATQYPGSQYPGSQYPGSQYPGSQYPGSNEVRVRDGQAEFDRRVADAVSARRISRTEGTRLRSDYVALIRLEEQYMRDGYLTDGERSEIEGRLDELDARIGDVGFGGGGYFASPRARLDAIARALPSSGLSSSGRSQVGVELGDLMRLEAAYARSQPTADDRAYLDRRITELETRVRIRR